MDIKSTIKMTNPPIPYGKSTEALIGGLEL